MNQAIIIMGVCGTGKTTIGKALAQQRDCAFLEGDAFHPPENVAKMSAGTPLGDQDRWPWLDLLGQAIAAKAGQGEGAIASCSALKRTYRERLRCHTGQDTLFVLLQGDRAVLEGRMQERPDHYMPASLLDSQLAILEPPGGDEFSLTLDVATPCADLVAAIQNFTASPS